MSHVLFIDGASLALSATMAELGTALRMGVAADAQSLAQVPELLYSEAVGEQHAYVAINLGRTPGEVHMELLYKALSLRKDAVLAVLSSKEAANVPA
jgi:ABC-2 type transport system ATP-binding protein